jgi:hypothetical protein
MIRINIEPLAAPDVLSLEDIPPLKGIPAFMDVTSVPVRCRLDGAIVEVEIFPYKTSLDEAPYPVYEFACRLCDQEDEIS